MKASQCFVAAKDYRALWGGIVEPSVPQVVYDGPERRSGQDRRTTGHDRRWNAVAGRRLRLADRRKR